MNVELYRKDVEQYCRSIAEIDRDILDFIFQKDEHGRIPHVGRTLRKCSSELDGNSQLKRSVLNLYDMLELNSSAIPLKIRQDSILSRALKEEMSQLAENVYGKTVESVNKSPSEKLSSERMDASPSLPAKTEKIFQEKVGLQGISKVKTPSRTSITKQRNKNPLVEQLLATLIPFISEENKPKAFKKLKEKGIDVEEYLSPSVHTR